MPTFRNKKLATEAAGPKPKVMPKKKGISAKVAAGVPLIASASGVKGGRGANRAFGALTGVTAAKSGVKVDPLGVAMAVSGVKLEAVAKALAKLGLQGSAIEVAQRALLKTMGQSLGRTKAIARMQPAGNYQKGAGVIEELQAMRGGTRGVFPRPAVARPSVAPSRVQSVANTIAERHYTDVAQRGLGHADAVELNRARVLRVLASERGVDLGVAKTYAKGRRGLRSK